MYILLSTLSTPVQGFISGDTRAQLLQLLLIIKLSLSKTLATKLDTLCSIYLSHLRLSLFRGA
jgi:hypothetical protein